jgi:hypothetical protein
MTITTIDENTAGDRLAGPTLTLSEPELTIRSLIEARIRYEFGLRAQDKASRPLVNSSIGSGGTAPLAETQIEAAFRAFAEGRLIVLLRDHQATSLEERITLSEGDEVTFLRLVPLIGG